MSNIVEQLRKHLASMTEEEKQKEWDELKHWNDVGPTVEEYIHDLNHSAKQRVEFCEKEIHRLELTGEWKKDKENWRYLKKNLKYWKHYLEELERK